MMKFAHHRLRGCSRCHRWLIGIAFLYCSVASGNETVFESLLQTIDARRTAIDGGLSWDFEYEVFTVPLHPHGPPTLDYLNALERRAAEPLRDAKKSAFTTFTGSARWEPGKGRYWFNAAYVNKWDGGIADHIGMREQIAYDGTWYWDVQTSKPGRELPREDFSGELDVQKDWLPHGNISQSVPLGGRVEQLFAASGFVFRPGYMSLPDGSTWGDSVDIAGFLRELQRNGMEIHTEQPDSEHASVSFGIVDSEKLSIPKGTMTIHFRLDQLGAIERISFTAEAPAGIIRAADFEISNVEVSPGVWFPEQIIWGNWMNPRVTRVRTSNVKVAALGLSDFQIDFAPGTRVDDHRSQLSFVASNTPFDEDRAIREYAATYLGDFSGLAGSSQSAHRSRARLVIVAGTILLVAVLLVTWWRRRSRTLGFLLATALVGNLGLANEIQEVSATPLQWSDGEGWTLPVGAGGQKIRVAQCGNRITSLALLAFRRDVDASRLSRHMRPTTLGIDLRQIVETLAAFRVQATIRKGVSWTALHESLPGGVFAIVAIPPTRMPGGHYVAAIRRPTGEVVLLDPPHGVRLLEPDDRESFETPDLVVAFLTNSPAPDTPEISVPELIEIESESRNWRDDVLVDCPVRNISDSAVWIKPLKATCGCVRATKQPTMIAPGETGLVEFRIKPAHWGAGLQRKEVSVETGGGTSAFVTLEAEFIKISSGEPQPATGTEVVTLPLECPDEPFKRQLKLPLPREWDSELAAKVVRGGTGWAEVTIQADAGQQLLVADLSIPQAELMRVRSGETVDCLVEVDGRGKLYGTYRVVVSQDLSGMSVHKKVIAQQGEQFEFSGGCSRRIGINGLRRSTVFPVLNWHRRPCGTWNRMEIGNLPVRQ